MNLYHFIRFGYLIVIGSFILMIWISLTGAREIELMKYPPCYFNPLCSCSKAIPDLGIVRCQNIHLPQIPETINASKVFMLHMENNGLRIIEPYFLQSTGLYKIVITRNPLSFIPDESFLGLERSLWELNLSHNYLSRVPSRALRYLQKLRLLDLTGNSIAKIAPDNWRGLENSLEILILSDNSITSLPTDSFSGLPMLETIDLRGNNLREIDTSVFRDGMGKLSHLILSDNQLNAIPYQALSPLKRLRILELDHNKINKMQPATEIGVQNVNYNFQFNLDLLKLDYNQITVLEPLSFQYFNILNKTYLDGNPLQNVGENAFRQAKIKELYMRSCGLTEISPLAFGGLENYLEILDLSGNKLSLVPKGFFGLELLKILSLRDNVLSNYNPAETFSGFQFTLYKLDLSGSDNNPVLIQDLRRLRNLRVLSLSRLSQPTLSPDHFLEFGIDLEELQIISANLQTINNNAFKHVRGLKNIDFSENSISDIESNAFTEIGHSLLYLKLSHAFSSSMQKLPADAIKSLTNLEILDISNNKIKNMPDTSFHFLKKLRKIYIQDNVIENVHKGTFQGDIHNELEEIYLSFNNIKIIVQHTFADLPQLEQLHLDDNKITSLERRSFMNLESLKRLNLKGNKIETVSYETFQNLPELEDLNLAYNQLSSFDFSMFDQVGTLAMLGVNMSYNKLVELTVNVGSNFETQVGLHSNIKVLDLSHNNITSIAKQFFRPVELSMTHLYLGCNKILNATKDVFGNMPHLQVLDISHNGLYELDFDTFRNTRKLQLLYASHNRIAEIPNDLFRFLGNLRIVDFSHNRLRTLPDNLFREEGLERLDVSHNQLSKLPLTSLSVASALTICELDLSWNSISSLVHGGILSRFKKLVWLDLSYNRLAQIDVGTFKDVPRLSSLNLGHNSQLALEQNGLSFQGLEYSLLDLNLDNVSLTHVPILPTPNLISLSLAHNALPTVPPEMAANISSLRKLDLSYNDLSAVPIVTHSLIELRILYMAANPLTVVSNTSLLGVAHYLEELDIKNIDLSTFETGALCKMISLRTLKIDVYKNVRNFNIPRILQYNGGLRNLEIHIDKETEINLEREMMGEFPNKLKNVTFSGKGLKKIGSTILEGIRSATLHISFSNTSILKLPDTFFKNLGWAKNVSLDVRNNLALKSVQNPSTGSKPNLFRKTFLTDLWLTGSKWSCDCDLGWVEVWQRKKRQYICGSSSNLISLCHRTDYNCRHTDDDLRTTLCENKKNQSLIDVLKTDIECGWSSASKIESVIAIMVTILGCSVQKLVF